MKNILKATGLALAVALFTLSACSGKHEDQGRKIGKKIDNFEESVKKKIEQGKEATQCAKENMENKARDLHENAKDTAHELINKS